MTDATPALLAYLSRWLDESQGDRDAEAVLWGRVAKVGHEAGEAIAALIGATGQGPRTGSTSSYDDVVEELIDVAMTAVERGLFHDTLGAGAERAGVPT